MYYQVENGHSRDGFLGSEEIIQISRAFKDKITRHHIITNDVTVLKNEDMNVGAGRFFTAIEDRI